MGTKKQLKIIDGLIKKFDAINCLVKEAEKEFSALKDSYAYDCILELIGDVGYYAREVIGELKCLKD